MPLQNQFQYQNNQLYCEDAPLAAIAAEVGTPVYVYSQAALLERVNAYKTAVPPHSLICYAAKANSNPTLLRRLAAAGLGADVTSGGELFLAQHAGFPPEKILFSGVGKRRDEIEMALAAGIHSLHAESEMELNLIAKVAAARQQRAHISLRVNPNIRAETHPYISTGLKAHKFGVDRATAVRLFQFAATHPWLEPVGVAAHIGSQITDVKPYRESAKFLVTLADELAAAGIRLTYVDVGGGLGIDYDEEREAPMPGDWITAVSQPIIQAGYQLVVEPGRSIVGPAGLLLTQALYTKQQGEKQFLIVDAGMNDLLRPTLYQAHHPIWPVAQAADGATAVYDIVGPVCESGDFLAQARPFPPTRPGDLIAVMQAGAYGFAMSSNYNGRLRPAEVLVDGRQYQVIRARQQYQHLLDGSLEIRD